MAAGRKLFHPLEKTGIVAAFLVLFQAGIFIGGLAVRRAINVAPAVSDFLVKSPLVWDASVTVRVVLSAWIALLLVGLCFKQTLWSRSDWLPFQGRNLGCYLLLGVILQSLFVAVTHVERLPLVLHTLASFSSKTSGAFWMFTASMLLMQLVATGIEEIVWRGVALKTLLESTISPKLAISAVALLFGLWHLFASYSLISVPYLFMIGLVTGVVYFWKRSFYAAWGTHLGINLAAEFWTGPWSEALTKTSTAEAVRLDLYLLGLVLFGVASWALSRRYKARQFAQDGTSSVIGS